MSTGWETTSPRPEAKMMTNGNSDHSSTTTTRRSSYVFIKELFTQYISLVHYREYYTYIYKKNSRKEKLNSCSK